MTREPPLKELAGNSRLALGFFNSLIRRIECTKPLAGDKISLTDKSDGVEISIKMKTITLNVCSNGTPDTITVYAPSV
jgi:hypothetical protein